jgi:hypothetical protein
MGHLIVSALRSSTLRYSDIPEHVRAFAYKKAKADLRDATGTSNHGCHFYAVRPDVQRTWTCQLGTDTITATYNLPEFTPERMRWTGVE